MFANSLPIFLLGFAIGFPVCPLVPLVLAVLVWQCFCKPRFLFLWGSFLTVAWVAFCVIALLLLSVLPAYEFMNPRAYPPHFPEKVAAAWFFAGLAVIWVPWSLRVYLNAMNRRRRIRGHQCLSCGYDLRASPDRCPECGAVGKRSSAAHR